MSIKYYIHPLFLNFVLFNSKTVSRAKIQNHPIIKHLTNWFKKYKIPLKTSKCFRKMHH